MAVVYRNTSPIAARAAEIRRLLTEQEQLRSEHARVLSHKRQLISAIDRAQGKILAGFKRGAWSKSARQAAIAMRGSAGVVRLDPISEPIGVPIRVRRIEGTLSGSPPNADLTELQLRNAQIRQRISRLENHRKLLLQSIRDSNEVVAKSWSPTAKAAMVGLARLASRISGEANGDGYEVRR